MIRTMKKPVLFLFVLLSLFFLFVSACDLFDDLEDLPKDFKMHVVDLSSGEGSLLLRDYGLEDGAYVILFPKDDTGSSHVIQKLTTVQAGAQSSPPLTFTPPYQGIGRLLPDRPFLHKQQIELLKSHPWASQILPLLEIKKDPSLGTKEIFKVYLEGDSLSTVTASLKGKGDNYLLWVHDNTPMSTSMAQQIGDLYQSTIQPIVIDYFGKEPTKETFPLLEEAGEKVNILFVPLVDAGGYFYSVDLYSRDIFPMSNERKIIYIRYMADDSQDDFDYMMATIAHELQHMIFYHEGVLANRQSLYDDIWINEGFSQLAEDLTGYPLTEDTYDTRVPSYLGAPHQTSLINWEGDYPDYGVTYLFTRYLFDRFGREILPAIYTSPKEAVIAQKTVTKMDFQKLFKDWAITLILHQEEGVDKKYTFHDLTLEVAKSYLNPGSSWSNTSIKGWGVHYTEIGPGNGQDLTIRVKGVSPASQVQMVVVERRAKR